MKLTKARSFTHKPLRDILLNRDELAAHAQDIAKSHLQSGQGNKTYSLIPDVNDNTDFLLHAYHYINAYLKETKDVVPAAEWLLDNYYLLKDLRQEIALQLPRRYEEQLPVLAQGQFTGYPRIFALIVELIEHTDSNISLAGLYGFIEAYQTVIPLSSGEIWAIPIMLKIVLLENIRRLTERVIYTQDQRRAAEKWLEGISHQQTKVDWDQLVNNSNIPEVFSGAFAERLAKRLRDLGPESIAVLNWIDKQVSKSDTSLEALAKLEHQSQAMLQVSMGHAITSLRFAGEEDWPKFFEQISPVEKILKEDPAQIYCRMDFESRDEYRHKVERLAKRYKVSEQAIAKAVLELAYSADGLPDNHVGYYLLGNGLVILEKQLAQDWGTFRQHCNRIKQFICQKPNAVYFASSLIITGILYWVILGYAVSKVTYSPGKIVLLTVTLLIPLSSLALTLVNWSLTRALQPTFFPKLDFEDGIPEELSTMVVVPTLLTSVSRVKELIGQLEVYYLANNDSNLYFAILGDFSDAAQEVIPEDEVILNAALEEINRLNRKYNIDLFYLFNRKRIWNPAEGVWMGWERKRGKLVEFNRVLRNDPRHSFDVITGQRDIFAKIKYVITLDADTQLPRDAAKRLIGTLAHPLQAPVLNLEESKVIAGYGVLQPRISVSVESAGATYFSRIFSGKAGVDPYTTAVSDIYQDLFGEGNYTGKGIYDVGVFHKVTGEIFPENLILSHDLIEGIYARTGLVTDVELIDGYPGKVHAFMRRLHRWVRGDWQILSWLFKPITPIAKWKIFDNARRSLEAAALVLLIMFSGVFPGSAVVWFSVAFVVLLTPCVLGAINSAINPRTKTSSIDGLEKLLQFALTVCFLPYQAYVQLDAIFRSLYRQKISHRKLLEWESAADTERRVSTGILDSYKMMAPALISICLLLIVAWNWDPQGAWWIMPIILLWLVSPWIAARISNPRVLLKEQLNEQERLELRSWARQIWAFFEDFVNKDDNWLPPDNFQLEPPNGIAHRTSPTNIGLALLCNLSAHDLGYISTRTLLFRIRQTLDTLGRLVNWKGHLYNWYDTLTLQPLQPYYVSTVDSGNLVVYLLTLAAGLQEILEKPIFGMNRVQGLKDTFDLMVQELPKPLESKFQALGQTIDSVVCSEQFNLTSWSSLLEQGLDILADLPEDENYWGKRLKEMLQDYRQELDNFYAADTIVAANNLNLADLGLVPLKAVVAEKQAKVASQALDNITGLINELESLRSELVSKAMATDFRPLYDEHRQLFSIGYRISDQALDKSFYDLLASEARQASFVAVAKGDIPKGHWFRLGRSLTVVKGRRGLVSWSGTMFEFLMPLLVMKNFPGTILDETYNTVIATQVWYGSQRKIPWGISESGFYTFDALLNYQYKAFGVPGLGLKRGLIQELVVAPYATFLALLVKPKLALENIRSMQQLGFGGLYGLFEAVDYTQDRVKATSGFRLVQSYMAHHQGMSLLSLTNIVQDNIMQRRFHSLPLVQSTELLLKERVPLNSRVTPQPEEREIGLESKDIPLERSFVTLTTANSAVPVTHFLSNGQYSLMLTNSGSGFSKYEDLSISRWREDVTRDHWGMYFFVRNLNSGNRWSATHQPLGYSGEDYRVVYAPDRVEYDRLDGNIRTKTEIIVSPEDQVEVRRINLTNTSKYDRTIEVTSYFEVVLARHSEDLAHPGFSNLFIETEFTHQSLIASRRPRRADQGRKWLMHTVAVEGDTIGALQYETDRYKFIGRGRTLANPKILEYNHPLSNTSGAVLDPILSLRQTVRLHPGQTAKLAFAVGIGESREEAIRLAEKYRDPSAIERVFELAWTFSQMELRHLGLSAAQANEALALGGNLLFLSPCRREYEQALRSNQRGQSSLWPYGISGDLPIVLVRVAQIDHLDFVRQLLTVHEYWRAKGLKVDLVVFNEDKSGYFQILQDNLRDLISLGPARDLLNRPGGIFLIQKEHMPKEDVTLLFAVARQVFSAEGGSCVVQFRKLGKELATIKPNPEISQDYRLDYPNGVSLPEDQEHEQLAFYNGYGGFTPDGSEYVIVLSADIQTPLPWANVIANRRFGFLVTESGGGYTWSGNSRENKLTPWSNDQVMDQPGEILFLRDEDSHHFWSPIPGSIKQREAYIVRHGQGYSKFIHASHGLLQELCLFVPKEDPVKVVQLAVTNDSQHNRTLSAIYYAELIMGVTRETSAPFVVSEFDQDCKAILSFNSYQEEFRGRRTFLACTGADIVSYTGDRTEFIGRNGSPYNPEGLLKENLQNGVGAGLDPCTAIQVKLILEPGETKTIYFLLGEGTDLAESKLLLSRYGQEQELRNAFTEAKQFWESLLGKVRVNTPDMAMNLLLNRWLLYQTVVCRLWARSAFYQSGGALGFRDQLQDVMALTLAEPQWVREQILLHAAHQFIEGDVQHWWHPERNKGIRTKFSDDLLWLPFVTADYVEHTKDYSIFDEQINYLEDEELGEDIDERYSIPRVSEQKGSLYEHCLKALDRGLKFGQHGLPLIGSGDWNDGFSRVGVKGQGESVWLGWFIYLTLQRFSKICLQQGDQETAQHYEEICKQLQRALDDSGWDGGWYRRAYFDDGSPMGSARNTECQIDAIAQSWAVLSGAAKPSRAEDAMLALENYLIRKDIGILALLTPPFDRSNPDPGYIKGYVPGVRENGGQYTHGAIWAILAQAKMGQGDKACELFQMLNPINHAQTATEVLRYKVEPYVMTADVYAVAPHEGRGGWSWYTGAAGWMYQAGVEGILGLNLEGDRMSINPCIPASWPHFSVEYRYQSAKYLIRVNNPQGRNTGINTILLDGQEVSAGAFNLVDDGKEHLVEISM